jgi:trafficking protein particle complex subunit 6
MTQQEFVSEQVMEALLAECCEYSMHSCKARRSSSVSAAPRIVQQQSSSVMDGPNSSSSSSASNTAGLDEATVIAAEMSAAKLERMGYAVGYRWTERLAQTKTWNSLLSQDAAAQTAAQQLEAVKFLCKEVWVQLFGKQIDKLQTNHRGVFVLKDLDLKYLAAFPAHTEASRVKAIQLLAFPCGVIRGCLADLGIPAVVSCDFLADGQNMSACSFNIKVK